MVQSNKKCIACGTKYTYCPDCSRADALKPTWYNEFCSESCKDLWLTLARYKMERLTKDEAKSAILELDLKPIESYSRFVQQDYAKVMAEEKKTRKAHKKVESVLEEAPIEIEQPEITIVDPIVQESEQPEVVESHEVVTIENE
jgi:hypothetical protein